MFSLPVCGGLVLHTAEGCRCWALLSSDVLYCRCYLDMGPDVLRLVNVLVDVALGKRVRKHWSKQCALAGVGSGRVSPQPCPTFLTFAPFALRYQIYSMATTAPVLSTSAEHIFEDPTEPVVVPEVRLSDEQLYVQYEIERTVKEIRDGRWKRIALQFPDEMLVDAPRVFERLREGLRQQRRRPATGLEKDVEYLSLEQNEPRPDDQANQVASEETLTILADTSYGACCVDEIAAEHVNADVVVHYGRSCLSPTARLPVIYVFTSKPLDLDATVNIFRATYPETTAEVYIMADIPYQTHVNDLFDRLAKEGYTNLFATSIVHNPSSLLPNRTVPSTLQDDPEKLKDSSIFHISNPPSSLLLTLTSRVKSIYILEPNSTTTGPLQPAITQPLLRRRYAKLSRLSSAGVIGILINTLSVSNYLSALAHVQKLVADAGKKSYVFVVGKLNAAKLANFAEVGVWVVIACWESSLVDSRDFYAPVITPFELKMGLQAEWSGEWVGDFSELLGKDEDAGSHQRTADAANDEDDGSAPPEFDLRTGRYVSRSRPMGRPKPVAADTTAAQAIGGSSAPPSSTLVQRAKGDVAKVNGTVSPAAEFLRSQRTWQGLGSDYGIEYERDEEGNIRGAAIEEGRKGVARGYVVREGEERT